MRLAALLILILCLSFVAARANGGAFDFDSQCEALERSMDSLRQNSPSRFRAQKLIAPATPIILSSLTLYVSYVKDVDLSWSDAISSGHGTLKFDDYLQYSPVAIMWGLDAVGVKPKHKFKQQTTILLLSALTSLALVQGTKEFVGRHRPDTGASNSFPSGHTASAFMCADILHHEFGDHSVWISVLGYSIAMATGYMRVYNERHYVGDIIAGAGIGMLSARVAYWIAPKINKALWGSATGYTDNSYSATISPCVIGDNYGLNLSLTF